MKKTPTTTLHWFLCRHDELAMFHVGYIALALVTALFFNLGWFALLIALHMGMDAYKFYHRDSLSGKQAVRHVLQESLVDLMLLTVGLVFSIYFYHSAAIASVSGVVHAEITIVRWLSLIVSKFIVIEHVIKLFAHWRHYIESVQHSDRIVRFGWLDRCWLLCTGFALFLLAIAPSVMNVEPELIGSLLLWELAPWNV